MWGTDKILEIARAPHVKGLAKMFPSAGSMATKAFTRPHGTVEVKLGMVSRSVHCQDGMDTGELRLSRSIFYPGWVLTGCVTAVQDDTKGSNKKAAPVPKDPRRQGSSSSGSHKCQKRQRSKNIRRRDAQREGLTSSSMQLWPRARQNQTKRQEGCADRDPCPELHGRCSSCGGTV